MPESAVVSTLLDCILCYLSHSSFRSVIHHTYILKVTVIVSTPYAHFVPGLVISDGTSTHLV